MEICAYSSSLGCLLSHFLPGPLIIITHSLKVNIFHNKRGLIITLHDVLIIQEPRFFSIFFLFIISNALYTLIIERHLCVQFPLQLRVV